MLHFQPNSLTKGLHKHDCVWLQVESGRVCGVKSTLTYKGYKALQQKLQLTRQAL